MPSLGLGHFTFLDLSPSDLVRTARGAGFDFVGLRLHPAARDALSWLPDKSGLKELRRVMAGEGIALYDVETIVINKALDPDDLMPALDAACELGARRVNVCADVFPQLGDTFAKICEGAASRALGVDLECMPWRGINTPRACFDLIAETGAGNCGYLVDALHHSRCGGTLRDLAEAPAGCLVSAQLCDAVAAAPRNIDGLLAEARGGRLLPGDGGLNLAGIMRALPKETVISVEVPSAKDPRPPLERARAIFTATASLFESERA
ncbi:sugar phosphate isomerase [Sulfitobacter porphyrae]|nr:sugar phosphate isomerase [Sulfitobacter porphyrae]